jgi:2-succinyl-5-enolpyruvyl-6-hydroxy-3-cyclohexene-1-carboxylate synthase
MEAGICDFVISPGSRNAPLSIALYEAEEAGLINLHVRLDERGAAFFALGLSKASNKYVVAICTSGTAAANYHPAILEAFHSHNQLLVITADRPARLRRTGANQTTDHVGLLAPVVTVDMAQVMDVRPYLQGGPIHFNMQFDEPLLDDHRSQWLDGLHVQPLLAPSKRTRTEELVALPRSLVIVGHDRAGFSVADIQTFVDELSLPIIAEDPLSFPDSIHHASILLSDLVLKEYLQPDQIIVIGRTTLSRSITSMISTVNQLIVIDPRTVDVDVNRTAHAIFTSLPGVTSLPDPSWIARWKQVNDLAKAASAPDLLSDWSEQRAISVITQLIPESSALFVGSSRPVRDIEAFATPRQGIDTFANRGLAGIDGNISCAFGIALAYQQSYAILGDLTFLHDISALVNPVAANLTIFIIDNNGGGIFDTLPQAHVNGFEKIFGTPHGLNLARLVTGFGYHVEVVKGVSDLQRIMVHETSGIRCVIVEVPNRQTNAAVLKEISQSLCSAVRIGSNLA